MILTWTLYLVEISEYGIPIILGGTVVNICVSWYMLIAGIKLLKFDETKITRHSSGNGDGVTSDN